MTIRVIERRLTPGRSRSSVLLVAVRHAHVFAWAPWTGADSYGVTLRHRCPSRDWLHYRLVVLQRGGEGGPRRSVDRAGQRFARRRSLTLLELSQWRTRDGTAERLNMKRYVRLKVSPGGRQI